MTSCSKPASEMDSVVILVPRTTEVTDVVLSNRQISKRNPKRSRNGCVSCKRLRIKCDETKPSCEYCTHTGRGCVYVSPQKNMKPEAEDKDILKAHRLAARIFDRNIDLTSLSARRLNSIRKQLQIGTFELKLLYCYREFVDPFIVFIDGNLKSILVLFTKKHFVSHNIVRNSIYAYTCLNTWQFLRAGIDITLSKNSFSMRNVLASNIVKSDFVRTGLRKAITSDKIKYDALYDSKLPFLEEKGESLYSLTNFYVMNLVTECNNAILNIAEISKERRQLKTDDSEALLVATIVLFAIIGMHSHNIVPLVKFDADDNYCYDFDQIINLNTDFLTISQNLKNITQEVSVPPLRMKFLRITRLQFGIYEAVSPIIAKLLQELEFLNFDSKEVRSILETNIRILDDCLYFCYKYNFPVPAFKYLLIVDESFRNLIRTKNYFALRILYAYCYICQVCEFGMFSDSNIWINYMKWFKNYTFKQGGWKYKFDYILFYIVEEKVFGKVDAMKQFVTSDPEMVYNHHILTHPPKPDDFSPFNESKTSESEDFDINDVYSVTPIDTNMTSALNRELTKYDNDKQLALQPLDPQILDLANNLEEAISYELLVDNYDPLFDKLQ